MSRSGRPTTNGRRSGPVVDRVRALRARELLGRQHRTPPSETVPMPANGREWPFILDSLRRRARGEDHRAEGRGAGRAGSRDAGHGADGDATRTDGRDDAPTK
ncbi:hypothetical protein [Acidipropionibacterium jensenii]|nr:hypothetical protein [Acidipropionibacterium jensenii]MDN5976694.1 hypothetical protein [Acidipropionibacterium jensenii]MDN5995285.1 hypothetical protein [Acidipropionibacterium jensenii]MDN6425717.1 hypothetical protein [Acidipropionibacterium jensenii]MDN6440518.1 hypothetical protein [Acidipropionibacterium jensenii]MDN6479388.1 hypothetical protein [Acidipropionibacterium jensenii]